MASFSVLFEILQRPTIWDMSKELMIYLVPLWIAVLVGIMLGWAWKPKWAHLGGDLIDSSASKISFAPSPSSSSSSSIISSFNSFKSQLPSCISWVANIGFENDSCLSAVSILDSSASELGKAKSAVVGDDDLEHLWRLVEEKDGGPAWIQMMDRSAPNMSYQAWQRDPEKGPPQYRSRTIYEDATPEVVRDFFWDDEFRLKWDDMLLHAETVEECPTTGTMVVQWVRKFPFFCRDREYVIGRRIWESGQSYYCITKGVPCHSIPRHNKPRRVDMYYSSWFIRAVESKRGNGQLTACEVLLFHHEEMGIPWEIAKVGVRRGMWEAVKKIDPGLRAYQKERESGAALSRCALMAQINTKVSADYLRSLENTSGGSAEIETCETSEKLLGRSIPRIAVIGGAIILACSLDRGLLTKAVIFGIARRFANMGKRL